jgi:hypothetical protein
MKKLRMAEIVKNRCGDSIPAPIRAFVTMRRGRVPQNFRTKASGKPGSHPTRSEDALAKLLDHSYFPPSVSRTT